MSADPNDVRKHTDWIKVILFVFAVVGFISGFGEKIMALGRTSATVDVSATKVDRMEASQNQMAVDVARTKLQAEMANGGVQELRTELHTGIHDINEQLRQLNITGRRR